MHGAAPGPLAARLGSLGATRGTLRIGAEDARGLAACARARCPAIVAGAALGSPALGRWTPRALADRWGERRVRAYRVEDGELVFDRRRGLVEERVALGARRDGVAAGRPASHRVRERLSPGDPLLDDVARPALAPSDAEIDLWISAPRTRSRLHFDQADGLLCGILGTKHVVVLPGARRADVHAHGRASPLAQFSRVDLARPDVVRFPGLRRVAAHVAELRPGDAIYLPGGAFHYVESDDLTISIGYRWPGRGRRLLLAAAEAYKRARGLSR